MPDLSSVPRAVRCAIYTRKSTDCVAGQEINSLEGQRAVCSAYICCQAHKGWEELPDAYNDEGFSGGNLERPALHRLLNDARAGRIDVIVFYKIDRLTRSLADFVRLMDTLQHLNVSFVSVTQSFDTSDSMGRMVLNILLTFAQFEREMMGERIRDKKAVQKRSGLYVGSVPPIGYRLERGCLIVDPVEAQIVREAFRRFDDYPTMRSLFAALEKEGLGSSLLSANRAGRQRLPLQDGSTYRMFSNPVYAGYQRVKGELVRGRHEPLVTLERWKEIQRTLAERPKVNKKTDTSLHTLARLVYDESGRALRPVQRGCELWPNRYYETDSRRLRMGLRADKVRVRGDDLDNIVRAAIRTFLMNPVKVRSAITRASLAPHEVTSLQKEAGAISDLLGSATGASLRKLFECLVHRVEVARLEVRVWVSLTALVAYLRSDRGITPQQAAEMSNEAEHLHLLRVNADLTSARLKYKLDFEHVEGPNRRKQLIRLIRTAAEAESRLLNDPKHDLTWHAVVAKVSASKFSRLLRLCYLAPDIKAAILDGRQPAELTERKLLYSPLPSDWQQQREMLGFPAPASSRLYVNRSGS